MGERIEESTQEKGHRQLTELLQELRVALPGVQVLFGFLLCSAAASAFLIAPSAIHRLDFAVVAFTAAIAVLFAVLWYTIPLVMRARRGRDAA